LPKSRAPRFEERRRARKTQEKGSPMEEESLPAVPPPAVPPPADYLLPTLSPEEVHKNILRCHRLRNRVERRLLDWIFVLVEREYSEALGAPSPVQYVMENLKYEKSEAYEIVDVAKALPYLPRSAEAFERGEISWSKLKQIVPVATAETEEAWLSFAQTHRAGALKAEVKDAQRNGRKLPRKGTYGLPNILVQLGFRLSREELEIVRKATEKAAAEMARLDGGEKERGKKRRRPSPEEVLLFLSRRWLERDPCGPHGEETERKRSPFDIVYQSCLDCKRSHVLTEEGPVEVPPERLAEIEKEARKVVILPEDMVKGEAFPPGEVSRDIPADVELKVLSRYGKACVRCGARLHLHLHHVIFRCNGGPNEVWNLCPLCPACHGCVHEGTLEVFLDSLGELHWRTKAERVASLLEDELKELASVPQVMVVVEKKGEAPPGAGEAPSNGTVESQAEVALNRESEDAAAGLRTLGYGKNEARELVGKALGKLSGLGRPPRVAAILETAVRGRPPAVRGGVSADAETRGRATPGFPQMRKEAPGSCPSKPVEPPTSPLNR